MPKTTFLQTNIYIYAFYNIIPKGNVETVTASFATKQYLCKNVKTEKCFISRQDNIVAMLKFAEMAGL